MATVGDQIYVDDEGVVIEDIVTLTEGTGEDAESWTLLVLTNEESGIRYLYEEYENERTLYAFTDRHPKIQKVKEDTIVRASSKAASFAGSIAYVEGRTSRGEGALILDNTLLIEDDDVVPCGPDKDWLARLTTPAADLQQFQVPDAATKAQPRIDQGLAVAITAWCLLDTFVIDLWFGVALWVVGPLCAIMTASSEVMRFRQTARLVGFAFTTWMISAVATALLGSLATAPPPELLENVRRSFAFLAGWTAWLIHRPLFALVERGARTTAVLSALITLAALLIIVFFDEDPAWFLDGYYYFGSLPWGLIWPILFGFTVAVEYHDIRNAPTTWAGFGALRDRIAETLEAGLPKETLKTLAEQADDLHDAFDISDDARIGAIVGYATQLESLAKALAFLAERHDGLSNPEQPLSGSDLPSTTDWRTLAADLRAIHAGGQSLRIPPKILGHG